jgi:membrane-associated protease RseP (regulator of RpoE activity)
MDESIAHKSAPGVLTEIPRYSPEPPPIPAAPALERAVFPPLNIALFLITLLTTTMAGAYMAGADLSISHPLASIAGLGAGLSFSLPLMAILLAHEMGHFFTSRRHGVETSAPYFIPAPFPSIFIIGTFGAFIRMRSLPRTRNAMFDIGAAGPWAGILVAVPCVLIGLHFSQIGPLGQSAGGFELGNSLLFFGLARWMLGVNPDLVNVSLNPIAFAGWLGLLVTTLNLLPVGQLDGGHVIYTLFPKHHRTISKLFVFSCALMVVVPLALGYDFWLGWLLWGFIAVALGLGHPSTADRDTPLDSGRRFAAWMTVALFIVTFSPVPVSISSSPPQQPEQPSSQVYEIIQHAPAHRAIAHPRGRVAI